MTIAGNDSSDPEVRVVKGDRQLDVVSHNHTAIVFRVPPGETAHNNLTVTVFNQVSDVVPFAYNPPIITELQDASGAPLVYGSCCRCGCPHTLHTHDYVRWTPLPSDVEHPSPDPGS